MNMADVCVAVSNQFLSAVLRPSPPGFPSAACGILARPVVFPARCSDVAVTSAHGIPFVSVDGPGATVWWGGGGFLLLC
jgi:hypothetical protein